MCTILALSMLILMHTTMASTARLSAEIKNSVPSDSGELWCVAKNNAEDNALQTALDWACGPGNADCKSIQQGGVCYEPNDIQSHASYAFNDYYVRNGFAASACEFDGTAALTSLNPSQGSCVYPSSSSARNGNFSGSSTNGLSPASADTSVGCSLLQLKTLFLSSTMMAMLIVMVSIAYIL